MSMLESFGGATSGLILLLALLFVVRMIFDFFVPFAIFRIRREVMRISKQLLEENR